MDERIDGNNRKLSPEQVEELANRLKRYTPGMVLGDLCSTPDGNFWNAKDTLLAIEIWYGVTYVSRGSYYNLLERAGIKLEELQSSSYESFTEI